MKFLIIIPAHNEAEYIGFCLQSLADQTYTNFDITVVNDGSTDETAQIITSFAMRDSRVSVIHLPPSQHQPGAKVVRTFYSGFNSFKGDFDIICKFDADIIFPKRYLEEIVSVYQKNPAAGMVSGLVYTAKSTEFQSDQVSLLNFEDSSGWQHENLSGKNHVRGPIKSYRRQCFEDMAGLRPVLGWDNLDVMLAEMHGWKVITLKHLWVKHLRPTAEKYRSEKAKKLGAYFYNIGLNLPLATLSAAKSAYKNKSVAHFFTVIRAFSAQNHKRELTSKEIAFIRNLRWKGIFKRK